MLDKERQRCPWCPSPQGCTSCSLTGDDPNNFVLIPKSIADAERQQAVDLVNRQRHATIRRWAMLSALLLGMLIAVLVFLVFFATSTLGAQAQQVDSEAMAVLSYRGACSRSSLPSSCSRCCPAARTSGESA